MMRFVKLPAGASRFVSMGLAGVSIVALAGVGYSMLRPDNGRAAVANESRGKTKAADGLFRPTQSQWSTLTLEPVEQMVFHSELRTEGKIAIDEQRATRIFSPYAGRIKEIAVQPGDTVEKGQLIFTVDASDSVDTQKDFVVAVTDLNKARSKVTLTKLVETRMSNLVKDRSMPMKDWEEAQANLIAAENDQRSAEMALQAVRNRLRLLGKTAAEIDSFEKTGTITPDAPVYSPLQGTVLQRNVGPGQYVNAGASDAEPVFRIGDISKVWLVAYIREADAGSVKVGQPIKFQVLSRPGKAFEATINYVSATLDPNTRRLLVRATIDNADGLLKPEMFANVTIFVTSDDAKSVGIPRESVIYEADKTRVWVAAESGALEIREVEIGLSNGRMLQVLRGLNPGDRIVTRGSLFIDRMTAGT